MSGPATFSCMTFKIESSGIISEPRDSMCHSAGFRFMSQANQSVIGAGTLSEIFSPV